MTDVLAAPPMVIEPLHVVVDRWRHRVPPPITLPCVCGGPEVVCASSLPADITAGVQRHQIEPMHMAYDELLGIPLAAWQLVAKGGR